MEKWYWVGMYPYICVGLGNKPWTPLEIKGTLRSMKWMIWKLMKYNVM